MQLSIRFLAPKRGGFADADLDNSRVRFYLLNQQHFLIQSAISRVTLAVYLLLYLSSYYYFFAKFQTWCLKRGLTFRPIAIPFRLSTEFSTCVQAFPVDSNI